jgi:prepilin peptidase CpaA
LGTVVGLLVLLPAYAVGGMGAGDVKLMAGIGAWGAQLPTGQSWSEPTLYAFCASAAVGGVIAVAMVLWRRSWEKHRNQFWTILSEFATIRDPEQLAEIAAQRKSSMLLLPYGIPIAIGTIGYFAWMRILI